MGAGGFLPERLPAVALRRSEGWPRTGRRPAWSRVAPASSTP